MSQGWRRTLVALTLVAVLCCAPAGAWAGVFTARGEATPELAGLWRLSETAAELWQRLVAAWQSVAGDDGTESSGDGDGGCSLDPDGCAAPQGDGGASLDPDG